MPPRREVTGTMAERGKRLRTIRESLGLSQYDLAPLLNEMAARLGLPANYRYYTVSRNESGTIGFEDAAVWLAIDPGHHSWDWFVFGEREAKAAKHPPPKPADASLYQPVPKPQRRSEPHRRRRSG